MSEHETVPDRLRAMADQAAENGNADYESDAEAAIAFRVGLAQCVATLRMAAAAWPSEQVRPPRPAAYWGARPKDADERMHEAGRLLGFEQGMRKAEEYTAAAEQDEREAAARTGVRTPAPGERETARVANVAAAVARHWREQREHPQHQYEPVGPELAARLDALVAQVDEALEAGGWRQV